MWNEELIRPSAGVMYLILMLYVVMGVLKEIKPACKLSNVVE
jgi:hypothetical protein